MDLITMKSKIRKMSIETFLNHSTNQRECFTFVPIWLCFRPHKGVCFSSRDVPFRFSFKMSCCVPRAASLHCAVVNRKLKNVDLFCRLPQCAVPE